MHKQASVDCVIDVELDDEQAARIKASAHEEPRWRLDEDETSLGME